MKLFVQFVLDYLPFQPVPPSYSKLEKVCGWQYQITEFTIVKLDEVNCLIQIFLQTHNLQRIFFRIFSHSHQNRKMISNKAKEIAKLVSSSTDRDKRILNIKSSFPFFSRCFWRSFLHKWISWFSCCVSFFNISFIFSVGFQESSAKDIIPSTGDFLLNIFSKML